MEIKYNVTISLSMDFVKQIKKNPRLTKRQRKVLRMIFGV
jgi:hypothetical protein